MSIYIYLEHVVLEGKLVPVSFMEIWTDLLHSTPLLLHPLCSWRKGPGCKNLLSDAPPCMQSLTRKWIPWIRSLYFFQGFGVLKLFPCTVFDKEIGENKTATWNLLPFFFFLPVFVLFLSAHNVILGLQITAKWQ